MGGPTADFEPPKPGRSRQIQQRGVGAQSLALTKMISITYNHFNIFQPTFSNLSGWYFATDYHQFGHDAEGSGEALWGRSPQATGEA